MGTCFHKLEDSSVLSGQESAILSGGLFSFLYQEINKLPQESKMNQLPVLEIKEVVKVMKAYNTDAICSLNKLESFIRA